MNNHYKSKYLKYKHKYLNLKNIINSQHKQNDMFGGTKSKNKQFYLVHSTSSLNNLLSILDTGIIKLGKDVPKTYKKTLEKNPFIYANIIFDNLINDHTKYLDFTIILDPKILLDYDVKVNDGWNGTHFVDLNKSDLKKLNQLDQLDQLYQLVNNFVNKTKLQINKNMVSNPIYSHEVIFTKPINLSKYIIGVTCNDCVDSYPERFVTIRKYLKRKGLNHIKILPSNQALKLKEFVR